MKKTPAPKAASLKTLAAAQAPDARDTLLKEIKVHLRELNEKNLTQIRNQTATLLTIQKAKQKGSETPKQEIKNQTSKKSLQPVEIEADPTGNSFILVTPKSRSYLSRNEMSALVKAAYIAPGSAECLNALYVYLNRERRDILVNAGITASAHQFFECLYNSIRSRFKPKPT